MNHILRLFVPALLVMSAFPDASVRADESTGVLYLAQNTVTEEAAPADTALVPAEEPLTMPPMPPARIHISTEKPVPEFPMRSATPAATEQTAIQPPHTTPGNTPAVSADTSMQTNTLPPTDTGANAPMASETGTGTPAADTPGAPALQQQIQDIADSGLEEEQHMTYDPAELAASESGTATSGGTPVTEMLDAAASAAGTAAGTAGAAAQAGATAVQAGQAAVQAGQTPGTQQQAAADSQTSGAQQELAVLPPQTSTPAPATRKTSPLVMQEISLFNVPTANLRTMKVVIDDEYNLRGIVYGEEQGYLRKLEADSAGDFREVWKSPPLNAPVREVFVEDIDGDDISEIVAYTGNGNIFIFNYNTNEQVYRTPEGTYQNIRCMIIANLDSDPQKELFFIATKSGTLQQDSDAGNFVQFDTVSQFDEWTSTDLYTATDMVYGNVDSDDEMEIILNTGEILSQRFKTIKWKSDIDFGSRLYLIDMDNDGILELVTEYNQSYVRVFDIDRRQEKW